MKAENISLPYVPFGNMTLNIILLIVNLGLLFFNNFLLEIGLAYAIMRSLVHQIL